LALTTSRAPWHLIPANNKPYGRLAALRVIVDRLAKGVSLEPRPLDPKVAEAAERLLGVDKAAPLEQKRATKRAEAE